MGDSETPADATERLLSESVRLYEAIDALMRGHLPDGASGGQVTAVFLALSAYTGAFSARMERAGVPMLSPGTALSACKEVVRRAEGKRRAH